MDTPTLALFSAQTLHEQNLKLKEGLVQGCVQKADQMSEDCPPYPAGTSECLLVTHATTTTPQPHARCQLLYGYKV